MTVTVEVKNQRTFDLLRAIEGLGLIHVNTPVPPKTAEKTDQGEKPSNHQQKESHKNTPGASEEKPSYHWLRGIHKNIPGASVENFLARCREDKEHEIEIERRQQEERARRANCTCCYSGYV